VDETTLISSGDASTDDGGRRQVVVGLRHDVHRVVDRLRNEDAVQRQDDAVVVLDMRRQVIVVRVSLMVMVFEVRVRDQVLAVRPLGAVHVLDRRERKPGQDGHEAQRERAKGEHHPGCYGIVTTRATEESVRNVEAYNGS